MDKLRALHYKKREINDMKEEIRTSLVSTIDDVLSEALVDFLDPELSDHYNSENPVSYKPHEIKVFRDSFVVLCFSFPFGSKFNLREMVVIPAFDFIFVTERYDHDEDCHSLCFCRGSRLETEFHNCLYEKMCFFYDTDIDDCARSSKEVREESKRITDTILTIYEDGDLM